MYETCPPEEMARKRDPLTAGVLLVASTSKAAHISETVWNGSGMVMRRPGYRVGISEGYCRLTTPRTISMTMASLGLKKTLRTLHDGDPLFESPKKRTELREVGYSE